MRTTTSTKLRGEELVEPWRSLGHDGTDESEFTTETFSAEEVYAVFDEAIMRNTAGSRRRRRGGGLDLVAHVDDGNGNHPRLRRLLVDLLEEYSATPGTPTCCARPSTAGSARTRRRTGRRPGRPDVPGPDGSPTTYAASTS